MKPLVQIAVVVVGGLVLFFCGTGSGTRILADAIISGYRGAGPAVVQRIDGTLFLGVSLHELAIEHPARQPHGTVFQTARMDIPSLWDIIAARELRFMMHGVRVSSAPAAEEITVRRLEGTFSGSRRLHDVELRGVTGLPPGSFIEVQRVDAVRPIRPERIRQIHNARLRMPYSEPVVFSATQRRGRWDARAYCKEASVEELLSVSKAPRPAGGVDGTIGEVTVRVVGPLRALEVTGQFVVDRLIRGAVSIVRAPGTLHVTLRRAPGSSPQLFGDVRLSGGTVAAKQTTVMLRRAELTFAGDPLAPTVDVVGASTVGGVAITIALTGTKETPVLKVTSNPPMAQDVLLLMLATGKRWEPPQDVWTDEQVSTELATDFIDYVFFGGVGNRIGRRFGITDLAITHGTETNWVGVETTIADRVTLGLQVDPSQTSTGLAPADGQPRTLLPSRVGAEVKITETTVVDITGERTPLQRSPGSSAEDAVGTGPDTEDSVFLKLKKRF